MCLSVRPAKSLTCEPSHQLSIVCMERLDSHSHSVLLIVDSFSLFLCHPLVFGQKLFSTSIVSSDSLLAILLIDLIDFALTLEYSNALKTLRLLLCVPEGSFKIQLDF